MVKFELPKKIHSLLATQGLFQSTLLVIVVVGAFFLGSLWTKVQILEKGGLAAGGTPTTADAGTPQKAATIDEVKAAFDKGVIKFGKADSKLVLVEVADPSCPYCSIAAGHNPTLNQQAGSQFVMKADGGSYIPPVQEFEKLVKDGKASFVYLYTPGHGNGEMGVKAMYCGYEAGKFWEVHDKLMTSEGYDLLNNTVKNDKTKSGEMAQFLASVFDAGQMKSCLDSGKYDSVPSEETAVSRSLGVSGTPGFYVNEQLFPGAYNFTDMEAAVKAAL
jgi:protein-disulfide isomerase